jgi:hypothetical protein
MYVLYLAQAVTRRPLTAEARVRAHVSPCRLVVDKVTLGGFVSEFFGFLPASHHSNIAPYSSASREICDSSDQAAYHHTACPKE